MGWLMQPRYFLFGLICIPQYMYRWGVSKAYIDILYADDVITQYDYKSKHKKTAQERLEEKNNDPRGQDKAWQTMHKWYATHPDKAAAQPEEARKYGVEPPRKVNLNELMSKQ